MTIQFAYDQSGVGRQAVLHGIRSHVDPVSGTKVFVANDDWGCWLRRSCQFGDALTDENRRSSVEAPSDSELPV
jgi:hypothetical protein